MCILAFQGNVKTYSKANPSMLRSSTKEHVLHFSWSAIYIDQERKGKAPFFPLSSLASAKPNTLNERNPGICTMYCGIHPSY